MTRLVTEQEAGGRGGSCNEGRKEGRNHQLHPLIKVNVLFITADGKGRARRWSVRDVEVLWSRVDGVREGKRGLTVLTWDS